MKEHSTTFPNILDYSTEAGRVFDDYSPGDQKAIPTSCLIGRDGTVVDAWIGYSEGDDRPFKALRRAGIVLDKEDSRRAPAPSAPSTPASTQGAVSHAASAPAEGDSAASAEDGPVGMVTDDPAAHALYDRMIAAYRAADTLYYEGAYDMGRVDGSFRQNCSYKIWFKKPNFVRMEASKGGTVKGILVGDGETFWTWWPKGRPQYGWEEEGERREAYDRAKTTSYMRHPAPLGRHSISHDAGKLGAGIVMLILDPSTFHGYTDSMQAYIDGVRGIGVEKVGDEECDVIHLSLMKGQREWRIWISKKDFLPRKLLEWVHVRDELSALEEWTNLTVNADIPNDKFAWKPPEGWTQFRMPNIEEGLLKPETPAPDFRLNTDDDKVFQLSQNRGKVVWIFVWRAG